MSPVLDEVENCPIHVLIAARILWRNEIAARGTGLGARPPIVLDRGLEARIACPEIAVTERRDVGGRLVAAEGKQRLRRKRKRLLDRMIHQVSSDLVARIG